MRQGISTSALAVAVVTILTFGALAAGADGPNSKTSGYISVPNGRLYYEDAGQGPCLVFVHDGLLHSEVYDYQFDSFAKRYRVIRYDRRGYGRSDDPQQPYSSIADLKAVFDSLRVDSAVVVGCSAGSALSIDFTLKYPRLVTGLVLLGPVVSGMAYTDHMLSRGGRMTMDVLMDPARSRDYFVDVDPYELSPTSLEAKARAKALLTAFPHNLNFRDDYLEQNPDRPAVRFLGEIQVPTLLIVGDGDIPDVHAQAGAIEAGIGDARRLVISGAGHLVVLEKPEEVTGLIREFVPEAAFLRMISRDGIPTAIKAYRESLAQTQQTDSLTEATLNRMGYQNLVSGSMSDALELFKLAVDCYPNSFNVYDSFGEALLASGDTTNALANYRRSLELNPDNGNAAQILRRLQKM